MQYKILVNEKQKSSIIRGSILIALLVASVVAFHWLLGTEKRFGSVQSYSNGLPVSGDRNNDNDDGRLLESQPIEVHLKRHVRAAARLKIPILATRPRSGKPPSTTTERVPTETADSSSSGGSTTTTTIRPTSGATRNAPAGEAEDDENASDDYEEMPDKTASTTSTTEATSKQKSPPQVGRKKINSSGLKKGTKKQSKSTTTSSTTTTSTTSTTTTEEPDKTEEGESEVEGGSEEGGGEESGDTNGSQSEEESEEREEEAEKKKKKKQRPVSKVKAAAPKQTETSTNMKQEEEGEGEENDEKESNSTRSSQNEPTTTTGRPMVQHHRAKKEPLVALPFIRPKNASVCTPEAFLEFLPDPIGYKWRSRGLVLIHILIVCYMFYSLALVCERYFMPSLEEFAQRFNMSEDVTGATLMSAGSSAPELFTAILGVFVAKGDVGTGAIVGSAVFNILLVIGVCAFVSTSTAQLQWWPVLRDSVYYTFTVLVLILIIYDERITAFESFSMICLYGVYIVIMYNNEKLKEIVRQILASHPLTIGIIGGPSAAPAAAVAVDGPDDVFGSSSSNTLGSLLSRAISSTSNRISKQGGINSIELTSTHSNTNAKQTQIEDDSMYLAALLVIIKHKRLFRTTIRFQSAARYVIIKMQHHRVAQQQKQQQQQQQQQTKSKKQPDHQDLEADYFEAKTPGAANKIASQRAKMDAYACGGGGGSMSKNKFSIVSRDDYEFWHAPPAEGENYYLWLAKIPVNYVLHYTIPDCTLYPDKYIYTFSISIIWTAIFSYIMVWMVTLIGFTFGIPDSVMGVTFLAAGTSVPDCYSSIIAARQGMADMAVSNSIGSNVFDILIGLSVPWFIQSAIYPGIVATVNSRGVIYSVILLFLSLIVTIYLLNKYEWSLQPRLGLALLIAYGLFIILTCMLEFNLFGRVNPPPCPVQADRI